MRRLQIVLAMALTAALMASGCAQWPARPVADASALAAPNVALVAFSVISSDPVGLRQLDLEAESADGRVSKVGEMYLPPGVDAAQAQVFLYQVPDQDLRFGSLAVAFDENWWRSEEAGPDIAAATGSVTYIGRLELSSIRMARYADSGRPYPVGARLRLRDAMEEDIAALAGRFPLLDLANVRKSIPDHWASSDFLELAYWQPLRQHRAYKVREFMEDMTGLKPAGPELTPRRKGN